MHERLPDVESDFSAIHRIDDPGSLTPQRFIDLAVRLPLYPGAVRALLQSEEAPVTAPEVADLNADRSLDSSPLTLQTDPILAGLIDYA